MLLLVLARLAAAAPEDDARRMLDLVAAIRVEYLEAFEGGEELEYPAEIAEAQMLLADLRNINDRVRWIPPEGIAAVQRHLDAPIGSFDAPDRIEALAAAVTARTGVVPEHLPPEQPSAARGRELFADNCAGCHGALGRGDGPDAREAGLTPADFTDPTFMRVETPMDFFLMITVGRRRGGMPEWAQSLSVQQRWDLVAHLWTLAHPTFDAAAAEPVWTAHCAGCHPAGASGGADLGRPGALVHRRDRDLMATFAASQHAAVARRLDTAQRTLALGWARHLSLGGGPAAR
ncbi:MAG: cytochrome c [bacterium]|nr:cytochrome c [bacterium]